MICIQATPHLRQLGYDWSYAQSVTTDHATALNRARRKFTAMDLEKKRGRLSGNELLTLADWIWTIFYPGGKMLSDEQRRKIGAHLLEHAKSESHGLTFDEFADWFKKTLRN